MDWMVHTLNHPPSPRPSGWHGHAREAEKQEQDAEYPQRAGEPDCSYYVKFGSCKYGMSCRFNHPMKKSGWLGWHACAREKQEHGSEYPLRPGEPDCSYYIKFGMNCRFNHPPKPCGWQGQYTPPAENPAPAEYVKENEEEGKEEVEVEEEGGSDPGPIQPLLDLFAKDQLVKLLRDAAVVHGDVLRTIYRVADSDPAQRKIFVHGLGWDDTARTLTDAFSPYGEIEDLHVVIDRNTGKCKGYGFILFRCRSGAKAALREPQKKIGNRTTACQIASVGSLPAGDALSEKQEHE